VIVGIQSVGKNRIVGNHKADEDSTDAVKNRTPTSKCFVGESVSLLSRNITDSCKSTRGTLYAKTVLHVGDGAQRICAGAIIGVMAMLKIQLSMLICRY